MRSFNRALILLSLSGAFILVIASVACESGGGINDDRNDNVATPTPTRLSQVTSVTATPTPACPQMGEIGSVLPIMDPIGPNGLSGRLHLVQIDRETQVTITLDDAGRGPFSAVIRRGSCPECGEVPQGHLDYLLSDVVDGESVTMVKTPLQFFQFSLAYVLVVGGDDLQGDAPVSCGNIYSPLR